VLQFDASGVRDASESHVRIAGHDVGDVEVVLRADSQTASPVRIHIQ
jgi:hypothetical protein